MIVDNRKEHLLSRESPMREPCQEEREDSPWQAPMLAAIIFVYFLPSILLVHIRFNGSHASRPDKYWCRKNWRKFSNFLLPLH